MKIKHWVSRRKEDNAASDLGWKLISNKITALVKYKNKKWSIVDLLHFLIKENENLTNTKKCNPSAKCLFDVETRLVEYAIAEAEKDLKYE